MVTSKYLNPPFAIMAFFVASRFIFFPDRSRLLFALGCRKQAVSAATEAILYPG